MLMVLGSSGTTLAMRAASASSEYVHIAHSYASACAHIALLELARTNAITTGMMIVDEGSGDTCTVQLASKSSSGWTITTYASFNHSYATLVTFATTTPHVEIISQKEQ